MDYYTIAKYAVIFVLLVWFACAAWGFGGASSQSYHDYPQSKKDE